MAESHSSLFLIRYTIIILINMLFHFIYLYTQNMKYKLKLSRVASTMPFMGAMHLFLNLNHISQFISCYQYCISQWHRWGKQNPLFKYSQAWWCFIHVDSTEHEIYQSCEYAKSCYSAYHVINYGIMHHGKYLKHAKSYDGVC